MKKEWVFLFLILLLLPTILSSSIDSELQKITHYAEEYETGNINYLHLLIYISSVRESLNQELGAVKQEGGILRQEQIRGILGESTEETKWVWVEGEEREKRLDYYVPIWRKIIFDGNKIQIMLEAHPSIFRKGWWDEEGRFHREGEEEFLIYRLNFNVQFKKPKEQLDIQSKIDEIKSLAEIFNSNPSQENAESLAKQSVNTERTFESYFRQSGEKCEDIMNSVFGSEHKRDAQKLIVWEISFYEGENFEAIMRLEMCDDCEWNWVNANMWIEGRGPGFKQPKEVGERQSRDMFKGMTIPALKAEAERIISEMKSSLEAGDYGSAFSYSNRLMVVNEVWNEKANDVWKQIEGEVVEEVIQGGEEQKDPYYWIKREQENRQKAKALRQANYEERKQFYMELFSDYEKREFYFEQQEWEKRLVEEFKEKGEEICNNNQDDNNNEKADCEDAQCGGKICGRGITTIGGENETTEIEVDFYCISGICQAKEEEMKEEMIVCGNHVCEGNETIENCAEDCSMCPEHPPINCSGKVMFKGQDENGCPLEPICVEENVSCQTNEDCTQPLCGVAECVEGICTFAELSECREAECVDGDKKIQDCEENEIITAICERGVWIETSAECGAVSPTPTSCGEYCAAQPHILCVGHSDISGTYPDCSCGWVCESEEPIIGNECSVRGDCGGENDVCSNGRCVTIPEVVIVEPEPSIPEEQPPSEQEQPSEGGEPTPTTGEVILSFFKELTGKITGAITGFQTEGESQPETTPEEPPQEPPSEDFEDDWEERDREEGERHEQEQGERCQSECKRPCVEKCIRESCGEEMDCNIDEESEKCEGSCEAEDSCIEKCMSGEEDWWKEFQEEHKEEKGVFQAGGSCRKQEGKTEGFIWFGGWGEPFEQIQELKNKYYQGGQADWCKWELENLERQRKEFEKGFNEEFVKWFFESYLANSAEDWEQSVSGIFELYWKNVDNIIQTAHVMQCVEKEGMPDSYQPIERISYDTEYGSLEFWEEIKTAKVPGMDKSMEMISPYMKVWIFPNRKFIQYEMKQAMKEHEFPGPPEDKMERGNEEGLTDKEREMLKQDKGFMGKIREIASQYDGSADVAIQFIDYATNEIVFNLYAQVNENDILKFEPMLPEEVPEKDIVVELDFEKVYDLILFTEKEMRGEELESPPWDKRPRTNFVKGFVDGIKIWFKVRSLANSAKVSPESAKADALNLFQTFFKMSQQDEKGMKGGEMLAEEEKPGKGEEIGEEIWKSKEEITGEIITE